MQVKNYCKKFQVPSQDVLEALTEQFGGTWLLTSQLNTQIIDFLNSNFGYTQPQLPQVKTENQPQLPQAKSQITVTQKSESLSIPDIENLVVTDTQIISSALDGQLSLREEIVRAKVNDSNQRILNIISRSSENLTDQILNNIRSDYQDFQNLKSQPVEPYKRDTSSYEEMIQKLKSDGLIKSQEI